MDEIDFSDLVYQAFLTGKIEDVQHKAGKISAGVAGDCDRCGETMPRLIYSICCRCRDKYKLG